MAYLSPVITGLFYAALAFGALFELLFAVIFAAIAVDAVTEFRRLRKARRAVVDDALPRFFRHVPRSEDMSDKKIQQWMNGGGRG